MPGKLDGSDLVLTQTGSQFDSQGNDYETDNYLVTNGSVPGTPTSKTQSTYDGDGNVTTETDALGNETGYAYDGLDEQTTDTEPNPSTGSDTGPATTSVYDAAGDATASFDSLGNVTASTYDDLGNVVGAYQGQAITTSDPGYSATGPSWTFGNLTPNYGLTYELYVHSVATSGLRSPVGGTASLAAPTYADDTPFGDGWHDAGTVTVSGTSVSAMTISVSGLDEACLLQQTSATSYDDAGNATATIDAKGNVSSSTFDDDGNDIADYQGQVLNVHSSGYSSSGPTWTFGNLSPNYSLTYELYACATATPSVTSLTGGTLSGSITPTRPWATAGITWAR